MSAEAAVDTKYLGEIAARLSDADLGEIVLIAGKPTAHGQFDIGVGYAVSPPHLFQMCQTLLEAAVHVAEHRLAEHPCPNCERRLDLLRQGLAVLHTDSPPIAPPGATVN